MNPRDKIKEQVEYFYKKSLGMNIESLLRTQDVISGNYYFIAEEYHTKCTQYAEAYTGYKKAYLNTFLQKKAVKIQEKLTIKEIEQEAEKATQAEWANRMLCEADIEADKILIKSIEAVLRSIQQRVSHLKKERELSDHPMSKLDQNW